MAKKKVAKKSTWKEPVVVNSFKTTPLMFDIPDLTFYKDEYGTARQQYLSMVADTINWYNAGGKDTLD